MTKSILETKQELIDPIAKLWEVKYKTEGSEIGVSWLTYHVEREGKKKIYSIVYRSIVDDEVVEFESSIPREEIHHFEVMFPNEVIERYAPEEKKSYFTPDIIRSLDQFWFNRSCAARIVYEEDEYD